MNGRSGMDKWSGRAREARAHTGRVTCTTRAIPSLCATRMCTGPRRWASSMWCTSSDSSLALTRSAPLMCMVSATQRTWSSGTRVSAPGWPKRRWLFLGRGRSRLPSNKHAWRLAKVHPSDWPGEAPNERTYVFKVLMQSCRQS